MGTLELKRVYGKEKWTCLPTNPFHLETKELKD
jgi:hypothetical protein